MTNTNFYLPQVDDILSRAEFILNKQFGANKPSAFLQVQGFQLIKDCYDEISDALRIPVSTFTLFPVAGQRSYQLQPNVFDNFNGINRITYANVSMVKISLNEAMERFGRIDYLDTDDYPTSNYDFWFNPPNVDGVVYFLREDDDTKFSVIGTPSSNDITNNYTFEVFYVQEQAPPQSRNDPVPLAFKPFIGPMAGAIAGKALEADKNGRGAALIEEWQARLLKRKARANRQGRRTIAEGYTQDMNQYRRGYKGGKFSRPGFI